MNRMMSALKAAAVTSSIVGAIIGMSLGGFSAPSQAQQRAACGERENVLAHLEGKFSEVPVSIGLDHQGRVIEVLVAPSGNWTIIVTMTNGRSCLMASGVAWIEMPIHFAARRGAKGLCSS